MTTSELAAVGFVRRLLESAKERAGRVQDTDLLSLLREKLSIIEEECKKETLRRKQDHSRLPGLVLRVMPACAAPELRSTLGTALTTCQLILPHLPEWALKEVRYVETFCRESVRGSGDVTEQQ